MKSNPLVSIIIVNWNGKKWLKKLFDSLLSQTYKNIEIIFVDNDSSDDSIKFVNSSYKDSRVKIIKSEENLGFAGGNNLGINNAIGKYILLINNDTWVDKYFLSNLTNFYNTNNFDLVAPHEKDYYKNMEFRQYTKTMDLFGHSTYLKKGGENFYLSGVCVYFKKKLYESSLGLDNNFFMYFEEVDWFWRLNMFQKKFSYVDDVYIRHAGAGSTGSGIKYLTFLWRNQNTLQMLLKNYSWFNLFWILPIYFTQNIFEIIFFLIILEPKIAYSYIEGWIFNIKNIKRTLNNRDWVQKNRLVSDWEVMKKMYFGFGKINHLINYFHKNE